MFRSMSRARNAIPDFADEQWGLITRRQLETLGIRPATLARTLADGTLERITHGVYRVRGAGQPEHVGLRAAWLALDPSLPAWQRLDDPGVALVSHASAAELYGVGDLRADVHEFTLPARRQTRRADVRLHRGRVPHEHRTVLGGLPVTRAGWMIGDLLADHVDPERRANRSRDDRPQARPPPSDHSPHRTIRETVRTRALRRRRTARRAASHRRTRQPRGGHRRGGRMNRPSYASPQALRRVVTDRLRNVAEQQAGAQVSDLLRQFAYDRLLARAFTADPDRWVLKGAAAGSPNGPLFGPAKLAHFSIGLDRRHRGRRATCPKGTRRSRLRRRLTVAADDHELEPERLNDREPCAELSGRLACLDLADRPQAESGREREIVLTQTL